jgi:hypothetical protein
VRNTGETSFAECHGTLLPQFSEAFGVLTEAGCPEWTVADLREKYIKKLCLFHDKSL